MGGVYADHGTLEEMYQVISSFAIPNINYHHHCHLDHDQTIETAVRAGLNYVDTSPFYGEGKSEEVLGMVTTSMRVIIMMMTMMVMMMITTTMVVMMTMVIMTWTEGNIIIPTEQAMP